MPWVRTRRLETRQLLTRRRRLPPLLVITLLLNAWVAGLFVSAIAEAKGASPGLADTLGYSLFAIALGGLTVIYLHFRRERAWILAAVRAHFGRVDAPELWRASVDEVFVHADRAWLLRTRDGREHGLVLRDRDGGYCRLAAPWSTRARNRREVGERWTIECLGSRVSDLYCFGHSIPVERVELDTDPPAPAATCVVVELEQLGPELAHRLCDPKTAPYR